MCAHLESGTLTALCSNIFTRMFVERTALEGIGPREQERARLLPVPVISGLPLSSKFTLFACSVNMEVGFGIGLICQPVRCEALSIEGAKGTPKKQEFSLLVSGLAHSPGS